MTGPNLSSVVRKLKFYIKSRVFWKRLNCRTMKEKCFLSSMTLHARQMLSTGGNGSLGYLTVSIAKEWKLNLSLVKTEHRCRGRDNPFKNLFIMLCTFSLTLVCKRSVGNLHLVCVCMCVCVSVHGFYPYL